MRADGTDGADGRGTAPPPLLLIFAITVTGITVNSLITPSIPEILDGLGAPRSASGLVLAGATAPGIVLAPVMGVLADRYGRRRVLIPCLVTFGVAGGLAGLSPNLLVLVVLRLFQGAGSAGLINLAVVTIGDHWRGNERARLIGRNAAVLTVSLAVFPPLGGLLTDLAGFRAPFALYPLGMLTALWVWRRLPRVDTGVTSMREQMRGAMPYLRSRTVVGLLVAGVVLFVLIFGLMLTVMPLYLEQRFGLSASLRGVLLALPAITSTTGALLLGRVQEAVGRRRLLTGSAALFVVAFAVVGFAPALPLLVVGILIMGVGEGFLLPGLQDVAASAAPASARGTVVAVWVGAARTGQTVGPLIAGAAYAATGGPVTFLAGAAVALAMPGLLAYSLAGGGHEAGDTRRHT